MAPRPGCSRHWAGPPSGTGPSGGGHCTLLQTRSPQTLPLAQGPALRHLLLPCPLHSGDSSPGCRGTGPGVSFLRTGHKRAHFLVAPAVRQHSHRSLTFRRARGEGHQVSWCNFWSQSQGEGLLPGEAPPCSPEGLRASGRARWLECPYPRRGAAVTPSNVPLPPRLSPAALGGNAVRWRRLPASHLDPWGPQLSPGGLVPLVTWGHPFDAGICGQSLVMRGLCPGHGSGTAAGLGGEGRAPPAGSEAAPLCGRHGEPPAAAHGIWAPHHPEKRRPSSETGRARRLRKQEEAWWILKRNQMGFGR